MANIKISLQNYILISTFKGFIKRLSEADQSPSVVKLTNETMKHIRPSMEEYLELDKIIREFMEINKSAIEKGTLDTLSELTIGDDADILRGPLGHENLRPMILENLQTMVGIINGEKSKEELYLNDLIIKFTELIGGTNMEENSFNSVCSIIKPIIENNLVEFKEQELSIEYFLKIIVLKIRDFLEESQTTLNGIDQEIIHEIITMCIENDIRELYDKKFQIMALLKESGLIDHLPMDKIMSIVNEHNAEETIESTLESLEL